LRVRGTIIKSFLISHPAPPPPALASPGPANTPEGGGGGAVEHKMFTVSKGTPGERNRKSNEALRVVKIRTGERFMGKITNVFFVVSGA